jgi:flagellar FliL protein
MAEAQANANTETAPRRGPGILSLVKAIAFVSVIVILEVAAATVFLPTAAETRKIGEQLAETSQSAEGEQAKGEQDPGAEGEQHESQPGTKEVTLGTYHVVSFNPSTGTSMSIDFNLFGVVLAEDEAEFAERFLLHEKRLNEQVTIAVRGMESADFTDPGLGLIKRIILEKVNRALGKTLVREAVFSEFSFIER